jgi:hypothetical protein
MHISTAPDFLEAVANHPRVYPFVSCKGCGEIRFGDGWEDCVGIEFGEAGGFVFHRRAPGAYEVHTLFLPRTAGTLDYAKQALEHMFHVENAEWIGTQVARDLPHVKRFALRSGFTKFHEIANGWERDSGPVDVELFELTKERFLGANTCQP